MNNQDKIVKYIEDEKVKLAKLEEKRTDLDRKIKKVNANIKRYTLMKDGNQMNTLSNALDSKGISIEDIMTALTNGDMLSLQEKMETCDGKSNTCTANGKGEI
ncbi:hypothetical protein OBV_p-00410 (plasmid) [Oscillibacter valericigenes Sjm18-20]|nr:hypothetical protein OBV_p-00410 [Oscillibacter valericigenes Sjm18-20]